MLAFDRENMMVAALIALMVAGLVVTFGALALLRRARGDQRPAEEGLATTETADEA